MHIIVFLYLSGFYDIEENFDLLKFIATWLL